MKKISRRSFITAMAAVSAAGVLAACGSSSSSTASSAVSSEATSSAASMDETGTHTVVDHGGNEVEVPNKVTRVVIDQIPILSTYMAYFEGSAPYIVGYCGSFKSVISDTVLKNIAPELLESSDTVYAQSDLNIEEIMKLNPDVILYNAGNSSHAEILKASGIPSIGFATVGASTEADPIERYEEWLKLLEQIFNEPGKTDAFVAAGDEIVTDVEARIAEIPQTDRPSALILWKYADGVPQVSGQGTFGTYWMKRLGVTDKALEATGFAQASMEQIYSWDPDILFLDAVYCCIYAGHGFSRFHVRSGGLDWSADPARIPDAGWKQQSLCGAPQSQSGSQLYDPDRYPVPQHQHYRAASFHPHRHHRCTGVYFSVE